ncbi:vancomycin resistance protein YoaR [Clostridium pascui]|uniref:VanW family protein n=1 Tax=Clostridium pascui TaxID=46609 RepID=UPI00195629CE|nr:VanW family protein [Clostridium pascui]MBM7870611.1 vancomycin resistance protein YoaR [Clostridium pascui]
MTKRNFISLIIVIINLLIVISFWGCSSLSHVDDKVYPKVVINDIDMTGKTKEEAIKILESKIIVPDKQIIINANNKKYILNTKDLKSHNNIKEIVNKAFSYGRDLSQTKKEELIKSSKERKFSTTETFNKDIIINLLNKIEKEVNQKEKSASVKGVKSGKLLINDHIVGRKLNKEKLHKDILTEIKNKDNSIINAEVKDILPDITKEELSIMNAIISAYETRYSITEEERVYNIGLATKAISGTLLMPGEIFSFNKIVGKRTPERGYKQAPIIIDNKLEKGDGGGVCQVSTTLYNAIIRLNIMSLERSNHTLAPLYIQPGFDATVSEAIDYKFKNTLKYPIYIEGIISKGTVKFNIYSNSSLNSIKYDLINEIYEKAIPKTVYREDSNLNLGIKKQEQKPHIGYKVKVYIVEKRSGKITNKKLISNDNYDMTNEVIKIGIKK